MHSTRRKMSEALLAIYKEQDIVKKRYQICKKERESNTYIQMMNANIARYNLNDFKHNDNYNWVDSKSS